MLFKHKFHEGIRSGNLTLTFRAWKSARVKAGNTYRFGPRDCVQVDAVDHVVVSSIRESEARKAGFGSAAELREFLFGSGHPDLTLGSNVFRVAFHYVRQEQVGNAMKQDLSSEALSALAVKLQKTDELSKGGAWTRRVLKLIQENPRTAASRLAPLLSWETRAFKARVRSLKKLGLTQSFEIGYELTPLGRAMLDNA